MCMEFDMGVEGLLWEEPQTLQVMTRLFKYMKRKFTSKTQRVSPSPSLLL